MQFVGGQFPRGCGWQGAHTGCGDVGPQDSSRLCCSQLLDVAANHRSMKGRSLASSNVREMQQGECTALTTQSPLFFFTFLSASAETFPLPCLVCQWIPWLCLPCKTCFLLLIIFISFLNITLTLGLKKKEVSQNHRLAWVGEILKLI